MRFRSQLIFLALSVIVPAFVAAVLAVGFVYREGQLAQEKGMVKAARAFSLLVSNELHAKEVMLRTLANSQSLARGDLEAFYHFASKMAPTKATTIILIDRNEQQLLNTRVPFGSPLPRGRASNIRMLMARYGATQPLVTDVFMAPVGKRLDFTIQVPVIYGNELRYFLVLGVNVAEMQPLLSQQGLPDQWLGTIIDRNGKVVARSRQPERFVGKQSSQELVKVFSSQTEGILNTVTLDGVAVKTFFSRVPKSDWTIVLSIPESELRRAPIQAAAFLGLILVMVLGVSLVLAQRIGAKVVARMNQLGTVADQLGRGEEVSYVPQGLVEVDSVGTRIAAASRQIGQSKRELEQRVAEAVAETEAAQRVVLQSQKLEALGRLTGGIAHEFNNLLQTLSTGLQLSRMICTQEQVIGLINTCSKAVTRATALTEQLSAFGRTQEARQETVWLQAHIRDFEQLVQNVLPATIQLKLDVADGLWPATIDPTQFELALINITINARDAMPSGGDIRVSACNVQSALLPDGLARGDYVRVRVQDSGAGMSAEVMAKALDPFFTTKKVGEGTGLGLPQAYGFARQSGGTLLLHSVAGEGTTVEIYLPRAHADPVAAAAQVRADVPSHAGTVLFVEDDVLVRESVVQALRNSGFNVVTANDADEASALLAQGIGVDVVFSDIMMPGRMSGVDLARAIRRDYPHVQVLLATGYSEQVVSLPGVQILPKPYDIADMSRALQQLIG